MKMFKAFAGLSSLVLMLATGSMMARAQNPASLALGEKVFKRDCSGCHQVGPNAHHGVGPHLNALFGRSAAGLTDFKFYSKAMKSTNLVWSPENFAEFIENPREMVLGNRQIFDGVKDKDEIAALTAYLSQF